MKKTSKLNQIISRLKTMPEILAVYIFGSSVYGKKSRLSDLDIGVIFTTPEKIFSHPKRSLTMYEKLFDIFFPLVRQKGKLDLIFIQQASLSLQKEVLLKGRLIYCKDEEKLFSYKEKILLQYADIKPLLNQFYQEIHSTRL